MELVDLFCGGGGFAYGFILAKAGFTIKLGLDNDFCALKTYNFNIAPGQILNGDIQDIHSIDVLNCLNNQFPSIIIASPPCESFSSANVNRKKTAYDQLYADNKGRLVLEAIRFILDLEPKIFVIENVTQLNSTKMRELILHEFSDSKYKRIYFNVLRAEEFGVPSQRTRIFISNIKLYNPIEPIMTNVGEAFQNLPSSSHEVLNHNSLSQPFKIIKKIPKLPPGGALIYFKGSGKSTYRNFIRLRLDQPSPTVMGKSRFIHPSESRFCSVREQALLMSYPNHFCFHGSLNSQYNQVGESVPPLLSKGIALQILKAILK